MKNWLKYVVAAVIAGAGMGAAYYYPAEAFMSFVAGVVFGIPIAFAGYLAYGLWIYRQDRKNRITVEVKPTEAMKALARKEAALKKEKELLYEEMDKIK